MREEILTLVYNAIDEVNAQSADGEPVEKNTDTDLLGGAKGIDSVTFVNLIVAIEEQIQSSMGRSVGLVDEDGMALEERPFRTVGTLATYVEKVVSRQ